MDFSEELWCFFFLFFRFLVNSSLFSSVGLATRELVLSLILSSIVGSTGLLSWLVSWAGWGLGRGSGGLDLTPTVQAAGDLNKAALDIAVRHAVASTIRLSLHSVTREH